MPSGVYRLLELAFASLSKVSVGHSPDIRQSAINL